MGVPSPSGSFLFWWASCLRLQLGHRTEIGALGYGEGDRTYHFDNYLTGDEEWYRVDFTGNAPGMQWGLDNVRVTAARIPEPSTWALLAIAAATLLFTTGRARAISDTKHR